MMRWPVVFIVSLACLCSELFCIIIQQQQIESFFSIFSNTIDLGSIQGIIIIIIVLQTSVGPVRQNLMLELHYKPPGF